MRLSAQTFPLHLRYTLIVFSVQNSKNLSVENSDNRIAKSCDSRVSTHFISPIFGSNSHTLAGTEKHLRSKTNQYYVGILSFLHEERFRDLWIPRMFWGMITNCTSTNTNFLSNEQKYEFSKTSILFFYLLNITI